MTSADQPRPGDYRAGDASATDVGLQQFREQIEAYARSRGLPVVDGSQLPHHAGPVGDDSDDVYKILDSLGVLRGLEQRVGNERYEAMTGRALADLAVSVAHYAAAVIISEAADAYRRRGDPQQDAEPPSREAIGPVAARISRGIVETLRPESAGGSKAGTELLARLWQELLVWGMTMMRRDLGGEHAVNSMSHEQYADAIERYTSIGELRDIRDLLLLQYGQAVARAYLQGFDIEHSPLSELTRLLEGTGNAPPPKVRDLLRDRIPYAFPDGRAAIPASLAIRGVLASLHAAQDTKKGWRNGDGNLPVFDFDQPQGTARVLMRPSIDATPSQAVADALWAQVRAFSDKDGDVLLAMMAQAMEPGRQDKDGATWITASAILDYRGVRPIMKREGKAYYRAGHRTEDVEEIAGCVNRLGAQWLELISVETLEVSPGKRQARPKRTTYESKLFSIDEQIVQGELGGPQRAVAWRYRLGRCITEFLSAPNRQVARLMQCVLEYDPYRQSFEKRLGRYFTIHQRIGASYKKPLGRQIGGLFDELHLPVNKTDPSRTVKRFEAAMDRLVADDVLPGWHYRAESAARIKALPARGWLSEWLACVVEIPAPHSVLTDGVVKS